MGRLVDKQIQAKCHDNNSPMISPFNEANLQPCSYDVCLDRHYLVEEATSFRNQPCHLGEKRWAERQVDNWGDPIVIQPGQFILASTVETFCIPVSLSAQVSGKSSWGRMGIMVHVTAGFIDPGFRGKITLEIVNVGSTAVAMTTGQPIAQITFDELSRLPTNRYGNTTVLGSHYQGQDGPTPARK